MLSRLLADQEKARQAENLQAAATDAAFDSYYASKRQQANSGGATPVPPSTPGVAAAVGDQPQTPGGVHLDAAYNDFFGKPEKQSAGAGGAAGTGADGRDDSNGGSKTPVNAANGGDADGGVDGASAAAAADG